MEADLKEKTKETERLRAQLSETVTNTPVRAPSTQNNSFTAHAFYLMLQGLSGPTRVTCSK